MRAIDLDALRTHVGREETCGDTVRPDALARFRATLEAHLVAPEVATVPPGFHWTLFQPLTPTRALREDGHPVSIGLLPEMPLPARMWAGGELEFLGQLRPGDTLERTSRVASIDLKSGRAGPLLFVSIAHEIRRGDDTLVRETQTLVYREPSPPKPAPPVETGEPGPDAFVADSRLLFRYSALTFNTHRIHYDAAYARDVEGYRGLVVHGPLQATLLMNALARHLGHTRFRFSYRGRAPLFAGEAAQLHIETGEAHMARAPGDVTMTARFNAAGPAQG